MQSCFEGYLIHDQFYHLGFYSFQSFICHFFALLSILTQNRPCDGFYTYIIRSCNNGKKKAFKTKFLSFVDCTMTWMSLNDNLGCKTYSSFSSLFITGGTNLLLGPRLKISKKTCDTKTLWLNVERHKLYQQKQNILKYKKSFSSCFDGRCLFMIWYSQTKQSVLCILKRLTFILHKFLRKTRADLVPRDFLVAP